MAKSINLSETFLNFLRNEGLLNQKLCLMISGGVDSMVLLHIATQVVNNLDLVVCHLDHGLRVESGNDLIFVQKICSKSGILFRSKVLTENKKQNEADWRQARQDWGQAVAAEFGAQRILTAHHATDLVETMIFRLTKGAGPSGLSPFDISTKPFWKVPKSELIDYAHAKKLKWQEDSSNLNTKFERNLIRQTVLPTLRKITPNLEKVFVSEATLFAETAEFLASSIPDTDQPLALSEFLDLPLILQKEWLRAISNGTPSSSEIDDCLRWLRGNPAGKTTKTLGTQTLVIKNKQISLQA